MLTQNLLKISCRLRLESYRTLFAAIRERGGSLSATEAFSADIIHLLGEPTLGQFADTIGISQPNATYKVSNLVTKGYVEKITGEDRREVRLHTCGKFDSYYDEGQGLLEKAMKALKGSFSPEELDTASAVAEALLQAME